MLRVARHFSTEVLDALSRTERHPGEVARERCSITISGQNAMKDIDHAVLQQWFVY